MTRREWFGWTLGSVLAIPRLRAGRPRWTASSPGVAKAQAIGFARACEAEAEFHEER
jgi:hypothetical protein